MSGQQKGYGVNAMYQALQAAKSNRSKSSALLGHIHGIALVIPVIPKDQKKNAAHRVCAGLLELIRTARR